MKAAAQQKSRVTNFGAELKVTKKDTFGLEKLMAPEEGEKHHEEHHAAPEAAAEPVAAE